MHGDLKSAILRYVFLKLGGNDQTLKDELYDQIRSDFLKGRTWKDIWRYIYEKSILNLVPAIVVLLGILGITLLSVNFLGLTNEYAASIITGALALAGVLAIKYFGNVSTFAVSRYAKATRVEMPKTASEEYEELLIGVPPNVEPALQSAHSTLYFHQRRTDRSCVVL